MSANGRSGACAAPINEMMLELHRGGALPTRLFPCMTVNLDGGGVRITLAIKETNINGTMRETIVTRFFPNHMYHEARFYRRGEQDTRINADLFTGAC